MKSCVSPPPLWGFIASEISIFGSKFFYLYILPCPFYVYDVSWVLFPSFQLWYKLSLWILQARDQQDSPVDVFFQFDTFFLPLSWPWMIIQWFWLRGTVGNLQDHLWAQNSSLRALSSLVCEPPKDGHVPTSVDELFLGLTVFTVKTEWVWLVLISILKLFLQLVLCSVGRSWLFPWWPAGHDGGLPGGSSKAFFPPGWRSLVPKPPASSSCTTSHPWQRIFGIFFGQVISFLRSFYSVFLFVDTPSNVQK